MLPYAPYRHHSFGKVALPHHMRSVNFCCLLAVDAEVKLKDYNVLTDDFILKIMYLKLMAFNIMILSLILREQQFLSLPQKKAT